MRRLSPQQIDGVFGGVAALGTILVLGGLVLPGSPMAGPTALLLLVERGWPAALWVLAALGLGDVILRTLAGSMRIPACRLPLGVAAMLVLDLALGDLGLLGRGREPIAWMTVLAPAGLGIGTILRPGEHSGGLWGRLSGGTSRAMAGDARATDLPRGLPRDSWRLAIPLGVPIGVLLLAATSTPGWLWASEFGGYDALSYHLQLPREWWFAGGIVETPHNAYGYLPGGGSAVFLHLMTLVGDPSAAAITCQILVALLTIVAAHAAATVADVWIADVRIGDRRPDPNRIDHASTRSRLAMVALLATPWVVVTGSLAYDEAMVMVTAALAVILVLRLGDEPASTTGDLRCGGILGLVLGAAVLAKASSGVVVVLPLAVMSTVIIPPRRWPAIVIGTMVGGVIACTPWLARNGLWTGNPVFPFATSLLGGGDWSAEQIARFANGHASPGGIDAITAILREFLLDDLAFGLPPGDPRRPQWLALPLAGLVSIILLIGRGPTTRRRSIAMLATVATAIIAWAFLTHAKARFLLAIAPLLAAAVGVAGSTLGRPGSWPRLVVTGAAWLVALGPAVILVTEKDGAPAAAIGADDVFDGRAERSMIAKADPRSARTLRADAGRAFVLRDLPDDARVVLVGIADPLHLPVFAEDGTPRLLYTTVWTRGPLERAFAAAVEAAPDADADAITDAAIDRLRADGVTHVLVAPTMLEVWSGSGWLDPLLTPERIAAISTAADVRVVHRFRDGGVLVSIDRTMR